MIDQITFVIFCAVVMAVIAIAEPTRITCPKGWWVEGVRPTGESRCLRLIEGVRDCRGGRPCPDTHVHDRWIPVRIFCDPSSSPRALDDRRTIACTRP